MTTFGLVRRRWGGYLVLCGVLGPRDCDFSVDWLPDAAAARAVFLARLAIWATNAQRVVILAFDA